MNDKNKKAKNKKKFFIMGTIVAVLLFLFMGGGDDVQNEITPVEPNEKEPDYSEQDYIDLYAFLTKKKELPTVSSKALFYKYDRSLSVEKKAIMDKAQALYNKIKTDREEEERQKFLDRERQKIEAENAERERQEKERQEAEKRKKEAEESAKGADFDFGENTLEALLPVIQAKPVISEEERKKLKISVFSGLMNKNGYFKPAENLGFFKEGTDKIKFFNSGLSEQELKELSKEGEYRRLYLSFGDLFNGQQITYNFLKTNSEQWNPGKVVEVPHDFYGNYQSDALYSSPSEMSNYPVSIPVPLDVFREKYGAKYNSKDSFDYIFGFTFQFRKEFSYALVRLEGGGLRIGRMETGYAGYKDFFDTEINAFPSLSALYDFVEIDFGRKDLNDYFYNYIVAVFLYLKKVKESKTI